MANESRLIMLDYKAVREAFDKEFKETMQLIQNGETHLDNLAEGFTEADRVLRKMPTVDAVEVVRCKDCKHFVESEFSYCRNRKGLTDLVKPDDFCSFGERKYK